MSVIDNSAPAWGGICVCEDPQLVHRGINHTGSCASVRCMTDPTKAWQTRSLCDAFRPKPEQMDLDDQDQPHDRIDGR